MTLEKIERNAGCIFGVGVLMALAGCVLMLIGGDGTLGILGLGLGFAATQPMGFGAAALLTRDMKP